MNAQAGNKCVSHNCNLTLRAPLWTIYRQTAILKHPSEINILISSAIQPLHACNNPFLLYYNDIISPLLELTSTFTIIVLIVVDCHGKWNSFIDSLYHSVGVHSVLFKVNCYTACERWSHIWLDWCAGLVPTPPHISSNTLQGLKVEQGLVLLPTSNLALLKWAPQALNPTQAWEAIS